METKTLVKQQLEKFPEEFSIHELVERLILIEKINKGIEQSKNNQVASDEQLDSEIEE